jgi:hypothetical protein
MIVVAIVSGRHQRAGLACMDAAARRGPAVVNCADLQLARIMAINQAIVFK